MPDPGLRWTTQRSVAPAAAIDLGEASPADIWCEIATSDTFQQTLMTAVRDVLAGAPRNRTDAMVLFDEGVTALDGGYARVVAALDGGRETEQFQDAIDLTTALGQGEVSIVGHAPLEAVGDGPIACLRASSECPTLSVVVPHSFRARERQQRVEILELLATLATTVDVRVHCPRPTAGWILHEHDAILPSSFRESVDAPHGPEAPVDELVTTARSELNPDGRHVRVLRQLAAEPGETLPYAVIRSAHDVTTSRVSQILSTLEKLGLVSRSGTGSQKLLSLQKAGSTFLDRLDAEIGQQAQLDDGFRETSHADSQAVCPRSDEGSGPTSTDEEASSSGGSVPYRTRYLNERDHHPVASAAPDGGIGAVDSTALDPDTIERHTRFVSYDAQRDEAVIAVFAAGPLQYAVSTAIGLASPRLFDQALPESRLDSIEMPPEILRGARCIGGLSDEAVDDPSKLRDALVEWGEALESMTTDLKYGDYDNRDRFRGEILASAQGLAGTMAHLLDVAGVDVVREVRLPKSLPHARMGELAQSIAFSAVIQSRYEQYAVYRQLFEQRENKRQTALDLTVDADDPFGSLIGGFVLRGPSASRLGQHLEGQLAGFGLPHPDAPSFTVEIPVTTVSRATFAETVERMCEKKNLDPTSNAVSIFQAITDDPHAVGEAFNAHRPEERRRDIRIAEVRDGLASLAPDRLLPEAPPTISKMVSALLKHDQSLTEAELANRAVVSRDSVRRHLPSLVAMGLVHRTESGVRIALSANTDAERGEGIVPDALSATPSKAPIDLLFEVALTVVDDPHVLGDSNHPLGTAFHWPPDFAVLRRYILHFDIWIRVARDLCEAPESKIAPISINHHFDHRQKGLETAVATGD